MYGRLEVQNNESLTFEVMIMIGQKNQDGLEKGQRENKSKTKQMDT